MKQLTENKMSMDEVFQAVATERAYQEDLWNNPRMSVADCLIYMRHHLNKALKAYSTTDCVDVCDTVMDQVRKVTGLGVACGEEHGMPLRDGYQKDHLFVAGDMIYVYDGNIYQCICSDSQQAVFAKLNVMLDPNTGEIMIITVYEDMFVAFNFDNPDFKFERVTTDDITRSFHQFT